jgi:hypothetical protein
VGREGRREGRRDGGAARRRKRMKGNVYVCVRLVVCAFACCFDFGTAFVLRLLVLVLDGDIYETHFKLVVMI